jgi:hypothetical protein
LQYPDPEDIKFLKVMKGHSKKVTAITINPEAQQVLVWFIAWNPQLCKALGFMSNSDQVFVHRVLHHSDMTQSWHADIHRISRQDSANMAHGEWPSKHSRFHAVTTLLLADQQASTNDNCSPLLSTLWSSKAWTVRRSNMMIIRQRFCCGTVYTDDRCWWGG